MGEDTVIRTRGITKRYGDLTAVDHVDLDIAAGTFFGILGPNGAGKTTLLRAIAGLHRASSGEVRYFAEAKASRTLRSSIRRRIGYLGHRLLLYPHLTGRENLRFQAALYDLPAPGERVTEMLAAVRLTDAADRPVRAYSRGMAQRLGLARAFLHAPELLLLDEPFTGLDPEMAELLLGLLHAHRERGGTLLMASHDLERSMEACTRGLVLGAGQMIADRDLEGLSAHDLDREYLRGSTGGERGEARA
jgi:heme ABC exporter ATP-binding subunit CcmA